MTKEKKKLQVKTQEGWRAAKKIADKAFKIELKDLIKEAKKEKSKEKMEKAATFAKLWKGLYSSFNEGLTPAMKALVNSKTEDEKKKHGKRVIQIAKSYEKSVSKFSNEKAFKPRGLPNHRDTTDTLGGTLRAIQKDVTKFLK